MYYNEPSVEMSSVDPIVINTRSYSDSREGADVDLGPRTSLADLFGGRSTERRRSELQRVGKVLLKRQGTECGNDMEENWSRLREQNKAHLTAA